MSNPFAPKRVVTPKAPVLVMEHAPTDRLRRLGAAPVVLEEVQTRWDALSVTERREAAADLAAMPDAELAHHVTEMEVELVAARIGGRPPSEQLVSLGVQVLSAVPEGTVAEIAAWVGVSAGRALAALVIELRRPPPDRRKTLLDRLIEVLRAG